MITSKKLLIPGSEGKPITADLFSSTEDASPLVIFAHGFKGFKDWGTHHLVAQYFAENGLRFLKFNFSHNGIGLSQTDVFDDLKGFSENTFSKELYDLDQVISFVLSAEAFTPPTDLYLIGHSLGGGISIVQTCIDPRIKKLATWASVGRFNNLWSKEQEVEWHSKGVLYFVNSRTNQQMPIKVDLLNDLEQRGDLLNIKSAANRISQPWLIVHGTADAIVPLTVAYELKEYQPEAQLSLIENGDHVFGAKHPWNEKTLPKQLKEVCDTSIAFLKA